VAITAVIFDIGNVLENNPRTGWNTRWAERLGMSTYEFGLRFNAISAPGDIGQASAREIEHRLAAEFELDTVALATLMNDAWTEYVGTPNGELIDYFRALRPAYRTGILSNSRSGATEHEAHYGFGVMCDALVYSHEVGLVKPDPAIYRLVCDRLDVTPADAVLVDDRTANLTGAKAVGMAGIRCESAAQTISDLERLLGR
jgi:epoxide hydrolase-like predicted phosphatase